MFFPWKIMTHFLYIFQSFIYTNSFYDKDNFGQMTAIQTNKTIGFIFSKYTPTKKRYLSSKLDREFCGFSAFIYEVHERFLSLSKNPRIIVYKQW